MTGAAAADIAAAVRRRYGAETDGYGPEWAALDEFEVGVWTPEHPNTARADLFLVRAWAGQPKGHERILVEVKVSRGDLLSELAKPEKLAIGARYAHRVYFAAPAGLVRDSDDLGAGVGLIEVMPGGDTRETRKASRRPDPDPPSEAMIVEAFRRAARSEARVRTAAADDPAAQLVAMQARLAVAERAEATAREASQRDRDRLNNWLRHLSQAGGVPCLCGVVMDARKFTLGRHRGSHHVDGSICSLGWPEADVDALAVRLGIIAEGERLAS